MRLTIFRLHLIILVASTAAAAGAPVLPSTTRVSVSSGGAEGNDDSPSSDISADGRFVAFASRASNLVPDDTNVRTDVFVHDRSTGETTRVSLSSEGTQGNNISHSPSISAEGRFVAFASRASNLVPGDTNVRTDVFVHDRSSGDTTRVSVTSRGEEPNDDSSAPSISADGNSIAFQSLASNLAPNDENRQSDIFVHDSAMGRTRLVSASKGGEANAANNASLSPSISADGRYVAFHSQASDLVMFDSAVCFERGPIGFSRNCYDVFVRDMRTHQMERVSLTSAGEQGNGDSSRASVSGDGRYVSFGSEASNLVANDGNDLKDVFVRDRTTGALSRISVTPLGGDANSFSESGGISDDGRFVTFWSSASNLVAVDGNFKTQDVFVYELTSGAMEVASVSSAGVQGDRGSHSPVPSADGRFITFSSSATNLVPGDRNGKTDVFVRDRGTLS